MIEFLDQEVRPADTLFVAFTGVSDALGGIPFEFHETLTRVPCAAMFVLDRARRWYQYQDDVLATVQQRIADARAASGATRLVCIGNSMGGFGALMFGARCSADAILAFAPQTAIDPAVTKMLGDERWHDYQAGIASYPCGDLALLSPPIGRALICYDEGDRRDRAHVEHLAAAWRFDRVLVTGGHAAVKTMKADGRLASMIDGLAKGDF